jgi:hypothetical protein
VDVDEALDRQDWFMEIEGPQIYVLFQLHDLNSVDRAREFLRSKPPRSAGNDHEDQTSAVVELTLGRFGTAAVLLRWDNEDFPRCFLIVDSGEHSAMHFSLYSDDIKMLADALEQASEDISPSTTG